MRHRSLVALSLGCVLLACGEAWSQSDTSEFEALFARAALWQVGSNTADVEEARKQLAAEGEPAVRWLLASKLTVSTTLEQRAFDDLLAKRRDIAGPLVLEAMPRATTAQARVNLARAAKLLAVRDAAMVIATWLDRDDADPELTRKVFATALEALATLDPESLLTRAPAALAHRDPWVRVAACAALGNTASERAATPLLSMAGGNDGAIVRGAAANALIALGKPAIPAIRDALVLCARPTADLVACGFVLRAAVGLQATFNDPGTKRMLDKVAALGPADLSAFTVALLDLGDDLSP